MASSTPLVDHALVIAAQLIGLNVIHTESPLQSVGLEFCRPTWLSKSERAVSLKHSVYTSSLFFDALVTSQFFFKNF